MYLISLIVVIVGQSVLKLDKNRDCRLDTEGFTNFYGYRREKLYGANI